MKLTFYFDYSSPFAYLASTQIERVAAGHELVWHPFLLGGLFRAIGAPNVPLLEMTPAKRALVNKDMHRYAALYGVPFQFPSRFPMNTVTALRMTLSLIFGGPHAPRSPGGAPLVRTLFHAYWVEDRDIADPRELTAIADAAGLDGAALLGAADDMKARLREATDAAAERGVPGAPSFYLEGDDLPQGMLFWGQDRLPLVERVLGGWRPACG